MGLVLITQRRYGSVFFCFMVKCTAPHVLCVIVMTDIPIIVYIFVIYIIFGLFFSTQSPEVLSEDIHLVVVDLHA